MPQIIPVVIAAAAAAVQYGSIAAILGSVAISVGLSYESGRIVPRCRA